VAPLLRYSTGGIVEMCSGVTEGRHGEIRLVKDEVVEPTESFSSSCRTCT
jgi:hypothetical protein